MGGTECGTCESPRLLFRAARCPSSPYHWLAQRTQYLQYTVHSSPHPPISQQEQCAIQIVSGIKMMDQLSGFFEFLM